MTTRNEKQLTKLQKEETRKTTVKTSRGGTTDPSGEKMERADRATFVKLFQQVVKNHLAEMLAETCKLAQSNGELKEEGVKIAEMLTELEKYSCRWQSLGDASLSKESFKSRIMREDEETGYYLVRNDGTVSEIAGNLHSFFVYNKERERIAERKRLQAFKNLSREEQIKLLSSLM